jgi:hypothetical protein
MLIGKIRMRPAASGAPLTVMRRSVEPVNKVNILSVDLSSVACFRYHPSDGYLACISLSMSWVSTSFWITGNYDN